MKLKFRYLLLAASCAVTVFSLAIVSYAQSSRSERAIPTDDDPLLQPLPPGIRVRAFIHTPRVVEPSHLGTCTVTSGSGDQVGWFDFAPWRLPSTGITWKLSESTVPTEVGAANARLAIRKAFATWATAALNPSLFVESFVPTAVKNTRLDGTNAILWKKLRAGVVGETYVWYDTATAEVVEVDTVFNNGHPWRVFADPPNSYTDPKGDCSTEFDAYDLQNIATHEFGHWIGLDDIFAAVDLTMYLFGAGGELKKRSLGVGDALGANCIYNNICE